MIEVASGKKCFDQLFCGDIVTKLKEQESRFDLFVATDVLIYIGEMDALMTAVVSRATPGALFLFSTEILDGEGVLLQKSGRYAHSSGYVHDIMKAHGSTIVSEDVIYLRLESGSWIKGNLFVVRLP
jgi:predicted TPR repeat methyltransferase